jgi:hypothetical protein
VSGRRRRRTRCIPRPWSMGEARSSDECYDRRGAGLRLGAGRDEEAVAGLVASCGRVSAQARCCARGVAAPRCLWVCELWGRARPRRPCCGHRAAVVGLRRLRLSRADVAKRVAIRARRPRLLPGRLTEGPCFQGPSRWAVTGSNRRPPACKAGALPAELTAPTGRPSLPAGARHGRFV